MAKCYVCRYRPELRPYQFVATAVPDALEGHLLCRTHAAMATHDLLVKYRLALPLHHTYNLMGPRYCNAMQPGGEHKYGHLCGLKPGHENPSHACACGHMWTADDKPPIEGYDPDCNDCNAPGGPSPDHTARHVAATEDLQYRSRALTAPRAGQLPTSTQVHLLRQAVLAIMRVLGVDLRADGPPVGACGMQCTCHDLLNPGRHCSACDPLGLLDGGRAP